MENEEQDFPEIQSCQDLGSGSNCCFLCHDEFSADLHQVELKDGTLCEVCCKVADRLSFEDRIR